MFWKGSECQEKYLWELSITPVGYFTGAINHSRGVLHGSYQSLPWGTSRELSITPMGYFTGAINHSHGVLHGSYQSLPWGTSRELSNTPVGCPTGTILHGKNKVFQSNRSDFPKVSFHLDGIWRYMGALFCNWKWIKWFRVCFFKNKNSFFYECDRPCPSIFYGRRHAHTRFLTFTGKR
jgi:hypothetical protein